jgi:hypothetical protein
MKHPPSVTPQWPAQGGIGRFVPPCHPLGIVFTEEVRSTWLRHPTGELLHRLRVLSACGPDPSDPRRVYELCCLRAEKAAWEAYIFTAYGCGMFEGDRGNDVRERLTGKSSDGFRSAIAECEACWFLAGRMRLPLDPNTPGRDGRKLDMQILVDGQDVGVEVKAPFRAPPSERFSLGDNSDKIADAIKSAYEQFDGGRPNLLFLVPYLQFPMFSQRHHLLRAAYGESMLTWNVNLETGEGGSAWEEFHPNGKFLNTRLPRGGSLKPDGFPRYRRVSAILCIEERLVGRHRKWIEHDVLVLHNPHAYHRLRQETWAAFPQFVPVGDVMQWTDGAEVVV